MRRLVLCFAGLLAAAAGRAEAQPPADAVRFATDVEKARAHLLVSEELYTAGQGRAAAIHAAHPVQELGNRLTGPVRRVDAARADRVRDALKEPGRAIEAKVPPARYAETVASVGKTLDEGVDRVAGAATRASVAFRARVLAALLAGMAEEYEEGFKDGRITQPIEYQDAYAFFRRAKLLYEALPPDARRGAEDFAALSKALGSREPPPTPMPARTLKETALRLGASLTK
jgi:hypothetical protein